MGSSISGAHYNPAISLGFFISSKLTVNELLKYITAQILGAFTGAAAIYLITEFVYYIEPNSLYKLHKIATIEILFTFIFVMTFLAASLSKSLKRLQLQGLIAGLGFAGLYSVGGTFSGSFFNPALVFGAAIFDLFLGGQSFRYIPLFGLTALTGGALAGVAYNYFYRSK